MSELASQLGQRDAMIAELQSTVELQSKQIAQLKFLVAKLTRQQYGRRSEQLDDTQKLLFEIESPEPAKAKVTQVKPHQRRRGGGRLKIPADLPRTIIDHDIEDKSCGGCGQERQRIGFESSELLDYVPPKLHVIEHRRWKYACKQCQEQVAIAPPVKKPIPKGLAGPGLLAMIGVGPKIQSKRQRPSAALPP